MLSASTASAAVAGGRPTRQLVQCISTQSPVQQEARPQVQLARRSLLAFTPLLAVAAGSKEAVAKWDGETAAAGSCPLGEEEGRECRQQMLMQDKGKLQSYESAIQNSSKTSKVASAGNIVDSKYANETLDLAAKLQLYTELDPYDPERIKLIKQLKLDGSAWVGRYASGGGARSLSGRKMYIAVDSVQGHMASYGLAPYPPNKTKKLLSDLDEARDLLSQGK